MTSAGSEPGWYFDPDGGDHERFWNGEASTEHRRSKPLTSNPTPDRVSEPRSHRRDDERLPLQDEADAQGGAPDGEDGWCAVPIWKTSRRPATGWTRPAVRSMKPRR